MFQKAYLFPFLNMEENISFGLKVRGTTKAHMRAEVARMLELVELPGIEQNILRNFREDSSSALPWRGLWSYSPAY